MALTYSPVPELGKMAPRFSLKGTDGKTHTIDEFADAQALVVVFMCNHCPYVVATQDRINQIAQDYASKGLKLVGISSNDATNYPADSFDAMVKRSDEEGFLFPYLYDESQEVAKAYGAVCTPDPYLFEKKGNQFILRYRGRIDDSWKDPEAVRSTDLRDAIEAVLAGKLVNSDQKPAMGCSIKWKR